MKNIITIQHAQAEHHRTLDVGSWTDHELTSTGKKQAENIGKRLSEEILRKGWNELIILSSPLIRAKQTAEPLSRYLNVDIKFRNDLRDENLGSRAIGKSKQWENENRNVIETIDDKMFPDEDCETQRQLWNRFSKFCVELLSWESKNIIIVSHGTPLYIWPFIWLGLDIKTALRLHCNNKKMCFNYYGQVGGVSFMNEDEKGRRFIEKLHDPLYFNPDEFTEDENLEFGTSGRHGVQR